MRAGVVGVAQDLRRASKNASLPWASAAERLIGSGFLFEKLLFRKDIVAAQLSHASFEAGECYILIPGCSQRFIGASESQWLKSKWEAEVL